VSIDISDIALAKYLKAGDARSFELLFRRLYPRMCAYAQKFLHDANESHEVVQEVFLALWQHRDRIDENQSLQGYLFTSVKNKCLNVLEMKKTRGRHAQILWFLYVQQSVDKNNSFHTLASQDLERDFNTALKTLPGECRKIFELSRFEGLQYQEIATRLDISIKTVETQMSRALAKLRFRLREHLTTILIAALYLFK
jgi:RNA polymerase sigma-70 factor (ECF subfamily)